MKYNALFIVLLMSSSSHAKEMPEFEKYLLQTHTENFCNNQEYINCMGINKNNCIQSFKQAINICMKSTDPKFKKKYMPNNTVKRDK